LRNWVPFGGGHWRFVEHSSDGVHGFEGRYREVTPPERLVHTFEWDGMPGYVCIETVTFENFGDGRTKVVNTRFSTGRPVRRPAVASHQEFVGRSGHRFTALLHVGVGDGNKFVGVRLVVGVCFAKIRSSTKPLIGGRVCGRIAHAGRARRHAPIARTDLRRTPRGRP
jgi:hypothetical protein